MSKRILMIAGPNGAGKTTTFSRQMKTKQIYEFINADEIAQAIAPQHPESVSLQASKLMIKRLRELLSEGKNFAFETTGAALTYRNYLKQAQENGYLVTCVYLRLLNPEQAIDRVLQRVKQGGHHVPSETIRSRFYSGLKNFLKEYLVIADYAMVLDNSSEKRNEIIAIKDLKDGLQILNVDIWQEMERLTHVKK